MWQSEALRIIASLLSIGLNGAQLIGKCRSKLVAKFFSSGKKKAEIAGRAVAASGGLAGDAASGNASNV